MGSLGVNVRLFEKENKMRQNIIRKTEDELIHDKTFITEPQSVKNIIRFAEMMKSVLETGERC